jgi:hypothetical protein
MLDRDGLWRHAWDLFYDCSYQEDEAAEIIGRWQLVDELNRFLVAITASGSVVSGWALWSEPGFKKTWATLAGIAALSSIIHAALGVAGKLKDWQEVKQLCTELRLELQFMRADMEINPLFPPAPMEKRLNHSRHAWQKISSRLKSSDLFLTVRLRRLVQQRLDARLAATATS